jgi:hypothetical protein
MSTEIFEQTFQVTEPARLKLSNIRGSVEIQAGDSGTIHVHATKHNGSSKQTTIEMSQAEDGSVLVETREAEGYRLFNLASPAKVDYIVSVPPACKLSVSCVSSSLSIRGVNGECTFKTVSGSMDLHELAGPFKINSVSGDISGAELSGALDLDTVSGDVRLSKSNLPAVRGSTVSGNLFLQTALGAGPYKLNSVSGDVNFFVPVETACTIELRAVSGRITSTLPLTGHSRRGGSSTAVVQGGGVEVRLSSVSGDLWIGQIGEEAGRSSAETATPPVPPEPSITPEPPISPALPVPPVPPAPPASPPERLTTAEILAMVERGELSVDEAIHRMQG